MPKKLGVNTKSVEAKARKDAIKQAKNDLNERLKEEELWKDDDKHVLRKQKRKEEQEKRKQEVADRKATNKAVYEEEMSSIKSKRAAEDKSKISRFEIRETIEKQQNIKQSVPKDTPIEQQVIEDNVNRLIDVDESARSVEDAIALLSTKEPELDRHPERRMKAAFAAFEETNLPRIKSENPNLRLSQLKQILKKDWMKSPDNPLNQLTAKYNSKD